MTKFLVLILLVIPCSSCIQTTCRQERVNGEISKSQRIQAINNQLFSIIKEFEVLEKNSKIYAIYFTAENEGITMLKQDTVAYVTFLQDKPFIKDILYRGILTVDSLPIAIFSNGDVGAQFYNSERLIYIPLDFLIKEPMKINYFAAFGIENDSLIRWIAP